MITVRGRDPYPFHSYNTDLHASPVSYVGERITARDFNTFQHNEHIVHVTVYMTMLTSVGMPMCIYFATHYFQPRGLVVRVSAY